MRRNNFHRSVDWSNLVVKAGLPVGFHFHDLRHTGNNLAAASGASTRELMHRMGHGSMRAALIYQHATERAGPRDSGCIGRPHRTGRRGEVAREWPDEEGRSTRRAWVDGGKPG